jgi:hypothetical protein
VIISLILAFPFPVSFLSKCLLGSASPRLPWSGFRGEDAFVLTAADEASSLVIIVLFLNDKELQDELSDFVTWIVRYLSKRRAGI